MPQAALAKKSNFDFLELVCLFVYSVVSSVCCAHHILSVLGRKEVGLAKFIPGQVLEGTKVKLCPR